MIELEVKVIEPEVKVIELEVKVIEPEVKVIELEVKVIEPVEITNDLIKLLSN